MVQLTATFNILRIAKYCQRNGEEKKKETKKFTNSIPVEITKKKEKKRDTQPFKIQERLVKEIIL